MANNYTELSAFLYVPPEKIAAAAAIVDRCYEELVNSPDNSAGECLCDAELEDEGVWFKSEETVDVEHVEYIARRLVDELDIEEPFYCSWANTCSKPRVDEFGGGCFVVAKGMPTHWSSPRYECEKAYEAFKSQTNKPD